MVGSAITNSVAATPAARRSTGGSDSRFHVESTRSTNKPSQVTGWPSKRNNRSGQPRTASIAIATTIAPANPKPVLPHQYPSVAQEAGLAQASSGGEFAWSLPANGGYCREYGVGMPVILITGGARS